MHDRFPEKVPIADPGARRIAGLGQDGNAVQGGLRYSIGVELIFEVRDAEEGGYFARALGYSIFTEADSWEDLRTNVLEATSLHFEDGPVHPRLVQLHYVKDELIPVEAA